MDDKEFKSLYESKAGEMDKVVLSYLPAKEGMNIRILEAMEYSVAAGGKRLRPMFMSEMYTLFGGGNTKVLYPFVAAMEMIHTYSLVHDDLPAMDNDSYRRGRLTTWKVYGDAFGVLAGDALLNFAFETAMKAFDECTDSDSVLMARCVKALRILAGKAGVYGMIGGQSVDVLAEKEERPLTGEEILYIHENKTAALIQASMMVGAVLAGADDATLKKIEECGYYIGIAFQIQDDILDVIGDEKELGKPIGSDEENHKQTYVTLNGLDASAKEVERMSNEAIKILNDLPGDSSFLRALTAFLIHRRK